MLYRYLGTSARADRPLDTNSQCPAGDQALPGKRPETQAMGMGAVASTKVSSILVSPHRLRSQPLVRGSEECEFGGSACTEPKSVPFLVCMERYNLAVVSGVFNARDAMQKKVTRGRTRIAKQKKQAIHTIIVIVEGW